ncbi:MAG: hypothetical protein M1840_002474 [Geoglossum simile]|nr:MAG: hypothetical protein M1840_002474 [Geoglossum simile]
MATLLPAISPSLFNASFINIPYVWPGVALPDDVSNSISVHSPQLSSKVSYSSFVSTTSARPSFVQTGRGSRQPQAVSQVPEYVDDDASCRTTVRRLSIHVSRKSSWGTDIPPPPKPGGRQSLEQDAGELEDIDLDTGLGLCQRKTRVDDQVELRNGPVLSPAKPSPHQPFHRWIETLRRKTIRRRRSVSGPGRGKATDTADASIDRSHIHTKSSSLSSMGFVSAVKTASISLASFTGPATSRKTRQSVQQRSGTRSSRFSDNEARLSVDSSGLPAAVIDEGTRDRAVKRRRVLEELLSTEESYIADLKILINVYFTLLASVPALSQNTRSSIHRNVNEILQLHEELYCELQRATSGSMGNRTQTEEASSPEPRGHLRWHSLDILPEVGGELKNIRKARYSAEYCRPWSGRSVTQTADPRVAADVAKVFDKMMKRFFAYEEYGAKYELMVQDVASTYKTVPSWHAYEKGIESLASFITSINNREAYSKKGLTFGDLLIKPIQRVCKYPLLFADLYKETPVYDCPESHRELEKVLYRLRETTREINRATDDPRTRDRIEKTWLLQDRLTFKEQPEPSPAVALRLLGHVLLCGVLHVTWQSSGGISGEYMACILFRSRLLLATIKKGDPTYTVAIAINLSDLKIEETNNGRGLQCHSALYSWKAIFESDHRLFELILSACSAKEEETWRASLAERSAAESRDCFDGEPHSPDIFDSLSVDIKPLGNVFGQLGTLARRISLHRAGTVGPKTGLSQVAIRNTHALRDGQDPTVPTPLSINRSYSAIHTSRIPIVSPKRSERSRLEIALADVWTSDMIPYPGMSTKRGDHTIRASATSMIRKLSMASITGSFSRRSSSYQSLVNAPEEGDLDSADTAAHTPFKNPEYTDPNVISLSGSLGAKGGQSRRRLYHPLPPSRTSSAIGFKRSKSARTMQTFRVSNPLAPRNIVAKENEKVGKAANRNVRKRWSNPSILGKAFSSEGIRKLFV